MLAAWLPVVVWAAVIFAFSVDPEPLDGASARGTPSCASSPTSRNTRSSVRSSAARVRRPALAVALAALYAVSDEIHQTFVEGRVGAPLDVGIDTLGALVGVLGWVRLSRTGLLRRAT